MAKNSVSDWDTTPANNTDVGGTDITGTTGRVKDGDNAFRAIMAQVASYTRHGTDLATAATLDLDSVDNMFVNLTGTTTVTAVTLTATHSRRARAVGAFQLTASASLIVNGSTSVNYTTTADDLLFFEGYSSSIVRVWILDLGSVPFTAASSSGAASLQFAEDTDNGSNKLTVQGAASMSADATLTLPAGALDMTDWRSGQIKFPGTANPSTDVNTLDEYEEGTFTPQPFFGGGNTGMTGTYTGHYIKIGKFVQCWGTITFTAKGSSTGTMSIQLPFTAAAAPSAFAGSVSLISNASSLVAGMACHVNASQNVAFIDAPVTTGTTLVTQGNITDTTSFNFAVAFEAST